MESVNLINEAWKAGCTPPDRRPIYEWAREHITLPNAFTITGPYNPDYSRRFLDIFDALKSDTVRNVIVKKPVRGGGTMIGDIWLPWVIANDPGPFMFLMQSDKVARAHTDTRTKPIMENCEPVKPFVSEDRSKTRKSEMIFRNGMYLGISGPSLNNLQSKGIRYLFLSEVWLPDWFGKVNEALGRTKDFRNNAMDKVFMESQAGEEGDDLDTWFHRGTMKEWAIVCLKCSHSMVVTKWQNKRSDGTRWGLVWDNQKSNKRNEPFDLKRAQETIHFECEKCGHPHLHNDHTLREWNRLGHYIQTNTDANPRVESFRWPGLIHNSWVDMVEMFHSAIIAYKQGNLDPLKIFFQKYVPESWSESKAHEASPIQTTKFDAKEKWEDEYVRFLTIDVQDESLFYWVARSWSKDGESRRLAFGRAYSYSELNKIQLDWSIAGPNVFIDSGFDTRIVYFQAAKYDWNATKGDNVEHYMEDIVPRKRRNKRAPEKVRKSYKLTYGDSERGTGTEGKHVCVLVRYSDITYQWRVYRLINGKGAKWLTPQTDMTQEEMEYRDHLFSEYPKKTRDKMTGKVKWIFVCPSGNNHWRDCEKLQALAATAAQCLIDYQDEQSRASDDTGEESE